MPTLKADRVDEFKIFYNKQQTSGITIKLHANLECITPNDVRSNNSEHAINLDKF